MTPIRYTNSGGLAWTPEHEALLRELFAAGYNDARIGARIGCTRGGVAKRRSILGLIRKDCRGGRLHVGPTEPIKSGPEIDAMFRAAEKPVGTARRFTGTPPPTLMSRGEAMT